MSLDLKMYLNALLVDSTDNILSDAEVNELMDIRKQLKLLAFKLKN